MIKLLKVIGLGVVITMVPVLAVLIIVLYVWGAIWLFNFLPFSTDTNKTLALFISLLLPVGMTWAYYIINNQRKED